MYARSRRDKRFGCRIRAGQTEHLMTSVHQFSNDCRTDEARGPGNKNTHDLYLLSIL
jgi:hypothetical protein